MAIGLAASMIIPSGVPQQILWASEFSAESSETVADVFGDNSESESGNRTGDKNNEKYEFDTGESEKKKEMEDERSCMMPAGVLAETASTPRALYVYSFDEEAFNKANASKEWRKYPFDF